MIRLIRSLVVLLAFSLLYSCSNNQEFTRIPENATFVVSVDFKNMALNALSLKNIMAAATDSSQKEEADKRFEKTGIDFLGKGFVFQTESNRGKQEVYAVMPLDNPADFKAFLKSLDSTMTESTGMEMEWLSGKNGIIGIKDKSAVALLGQASELDGKKQEYLSGLLNLPEEKQLIAKNERFKTLKDKGFDVGFWVNTNKAFDLKSLSMAGAMAPNGGELLAALDFEDGMISFSGQGFNEEPEMKALNACFKQNLDAGFLATIPKEKPVGLMAIRVDLPGIFKIMEKSPLSEGVIQTITQAGFKKDDVFGALSGQIGVGVLEMPMAGSFMPIVHASAEIADLAKLNAVLAQMTAMQVIQKTGESEWTFGVPGVSMFKMQAKDKLLTLTNANAGAAKETYSMDKTPGLESGYAVMLVDFEKIGSNLPPGEMKENFEAFSKTWPSLSGWSKVDNETTSSFSMRLNSSKPDENTLVTLGGFSKVLQKRFNPGGLLSPQPAYPIEETATETMVDSTAAPEEGSY